MPHLSIAHRDDQGEVPAFAATLQEQVKAIESLRDQTACHLRGERLPLKTERAPAKKGLA